MDLHITDGTVLVGLKITHDACFTNWNTNMSYKLEQNNNASTQAMLYLWYLCTTSFRVHYTVLFIYWFWTSWFDSVDISKLHITHISVISNPATIDRIISFWSFKQLSKLLLFLWHLQYTSLFPLTWQYMLLELCLKHSHMKWNWQHLGGETCNDKLWTTIHTAQSLQEKRIIIINKRVYKVKNKVKCTGTEAL